MAQEPYRAMTELTFPELLSLKKHFTRERGYLVHTEIGVADADAQQYDRLSAFIYDIDAAIQEKFLQYSIDIKQ